jgi:GntR family histidine utilization transcriptional repressor
MIPNEADLALEFGCARATVNRALRSVAESGLLDRKRKAGTRVALQPVARATLAIPIIRQEVEQAGQRYGYSLLAHVNAPPPPPVRAALALAPDDTALHLTALHLRDDRPYVIEDRWINTSAVPSAATAPFDTISPNEWLLHSIAYTHGDIAFSAASATQFEATTLDCPPSAALFVIDRLTWDNASALTKVRLIYAPGHQLRASI